MHVLILFVLGAGAADIGTLTEVDLDADGDGFGAADGDCDDDDASVYPAAYDTPHDGIDQDCNGADAAYCFVDLDQDGHGGNTLLYASDGSCDAADGEASSNDDCNDNNASIHPGAYDPPGDGTDQNCDGVDQALCYFDADRDGHGSRSDQLVSDDGDCSDPGEAPTGYDCDDENAEIHPGATEIPVSGIDEDCDGLELCFVDEDWDGFGDPELTSTPALDCDAVGVAPVTGESCPGFDDALDRDGDGVANGCDACPRDVANDSDGDGVCDSDDACPGGDDRVDRDGDSIPDACAEAFEDLDGDGIPDVYDPDPSSAGDDGAPAGPDPKFGFGCNTTPTGAWLGLWVLLLGRRRVRRA